MPKNTRKQSFISSSLSLATISLILSLGISHYDSVQGLDIDSISTSLNTTKIAQKSNSQQKVRVAVLDFDYSSVGNPLFLSFFPGGAEGISDLVVNELVKSGQYTVNYRSNTTGC